MSNDEPNNKLKPSAYKPIDLLELPQAERKLMKWLMRERGASLSEIVQYLDDSLESTQELLNILVDKGLVRKQEQDGMEVFSAHLTSKTQRRKTSNRISSKTSNNIWDRLG